jgi:hypothetical protein
VLKKALLTMAMTGIAVGASALPAMAADVSIPLVNGCSLNTHVKTDADPQANPPVDLTGTNVGTNCP